MCLPPQRDLHVGAREAGASAVHQSRGSRVATRILEGAAVAVPRPGPLDQTSAAHSLSAPERPRGTALTAGLPSSLRTAGIQTSTSAIIPHSRDRRRTALSPQVRPDNPADTASPQNIASAANGVPKTSKRQVADWKGPAALTPSLHQLNTPRYHPCLGSIRR